MLNIYVPLIFAFYVRFARCKIESCVFMVHEIQKRLGEQACKNAVYWKWRHKKHTAMRENRWRENCNHKSWKFVKVKKTEQEKENLLSLSIGDEKIKQ